MGNGGVLVGLFIGLLLLSWEIAGVLAKGPQIDTISQGYWWIRDWTKRNTGLAGYGVLSATMLGFLSWLMWHLALGSH
jgi:hypothetical protein